MCLEVTFEGVNSSDRDTSMAADIWSRFEEQQRSKIGFYLGHLEERLTGGTQRTTGLMVRYMYEVVKVSRLLSRKDLVR